MRIITANLNGVRSAAKKGFFTWLRRQNADVVCLQETRAQLEQLQDPVFHPSGYHCTYVEAKKKGYAGVALYSRQPVKKMVTTMGCKEFDDEGRYVEAYFDGLCVASLYAPSGSSSEQRQASKERFLDYFLSFLQRKKHAKNELIVCGDFNIAHKEIDLKNWRGNRGNSGFLPHERAWMDELFDRLGYMDAFREINQQAEQYTWWSNRGQARANNVGWRIDYQILSSGLRGKVVAANIYTAKRFSDHAPLVMDYDL